MKISDLLNWEKWGLINLNQFYNYKIYIADELPQVQKIDLFQSLDSHPVISHFNLKKILNFTSVRAESDFILVPHNWVHIKNNKEYLKGLYAFSHTTPILIVNSGDISPKVDLPNILELRTFLHPWEDSFRKIIIPYGVKEREFNLRDWRPIPTITFMGHIPKLSAYSLLGKNFKGILSPIKSSYYLNRKFSTLKLKYIGPKFRCEVTKRDNFTAYKSNPNLGLHMREFQESLNKSDYVLCPRGAGNFSVRFYEVLSSGATPILVDSGSHLPIISQDKFWQSNILNLSLFENWSEKIITDWKSLHAEGKYVRRQIENKEIFKKELNIKSYISALFEKYIK